MHPEHVEITLNPITSLPAEILDELKYYVYLYRDPEDDEVLYVGKGQGNRMFAHAIEALKSDRSSRKLDRIREITAAGHNVVLVVVRHGLTSKEALEVEGALIDLYPDALNVADGHHNAKRGMMTLGELVAEYGAEQAKITEPCVLININKLWHRGLPADPEKLYHAVRGSWAVQPRNNAQATYAFAVARGIIREVYRISGDVGADIRGWIPYEMDLLFPSLEKHPTPIRYALNAQVAPDMASFIGKSVTQHQEPGAQNPVRWLHCKLPVPSKTRPRRPRAPK